ncbi:MAG: hypothetical protein ACKKMW_01195 [Candidatus Nealsonbacteria bacterium]
MKEEILENISNVLTKPLEKERVIYLMVEIRKFIERTEGETKRWVNIKHWCDWVVHTQLDRKFAIETLNSMENYLIKNPENKFQWSDFNRRFVSLESLRQELYKFLKENGLSTDITNIPPWNDFSRFLAETLRDCHLVKNNGLVRKFFFSKKEHIPEAQKYSIDFELHFDGGRPNLWGTVLGSEDESQNKS